MLLGVGLAAERGIRSELSSRTALRARKSRDGRLDSTTRDRATQHGGRRPGGFAAPSWPAIAAWDGGLIQLALGAGAITTEGASPAIRVAGIVLVVTGAGAVGWGAATLARGRTVVPRLSIAGSVAGILAAAGDMALDPTRVSVFGVAAASRC